MYLKDKYFDSMKNIFTVSIILSMILIPTFVFAEEFFITQNNEADNIIFDGKWSFEREWKQSSIKKIRAYTARFKSKFTKLQYTMLYCKLNKIRTILHITILFVF